MKGPAYDLRPCGLNVVAALVREHHGYGSAGGYSTYTFAVYEDEQPVAAYVWQPPPVGAGRSTCPEEPSAVLALSRMVALPRAERRLRHISKPLRRQMLHLIDRGRWPVLVTYSDESQGHTGHVYKCSGWEKTVRARRPYFIDADGNRASSYSNGRHGERVLERGGYAVFQRWEHWACDRGAAALHMAAAGWVREPVPGRVWRSGNAANRWVLRARDPAGEAAR